MPGIVASLNEDDLSVLCVDAYLYLCMMYFVFEMTLSACVYIIPVVKMLLYVLVYY